MYSIFKTIYFNLKYFKLNVAIKLPLLLTTNVFLKQVQGKIIIDGPIKSGMIRIGVGGVGIFDHKKSRSIWEVSGEVVFKGTARIGHGSKISVSHSGKLIIGDGFIMTAESSICCFTEISFGNHCFLSWDILIMDSDYHKIIDETGKIINPDAPIIIRDNVWIGCRCTILKGSFIEKDNIIAACSLVNGIHLEQNQILGGIPARVVKKNVTWLP